MKILKTQKGCLSILTGRTDMGKSTMAVFNCAEQIKEGENIVFFSYEYCQSIIFNKLVSHFGIKWQELYNLVVVDGKGCGLREIKEIIKTRQGNVDTIYIDYLDLLRQEMVKIDPKLDELSKVELLQQIVSDLADLAVKYQVSVVILTQANKEGKMDDLVNWLNLVAATVHSPVPTYKMLIDRNEAFSPQIKCTDISHVILVDGNDLVHYSSINLKEAYKY